MPRKNKVEQYEYVKITGGKKQTKTKRTKKPKGSGDVVQTVIVQTGGRRRRPTKPKPEPWLPLASPQPQTLMTANIPYQFRQEGKQEPFVPQAIVQAQPRRVAKTDFGVQAMPTQAEFGVQAMPTQAEFGVQAMPTQAEFGVQAAPEMVETGSDPFRPTMTIRVPTQFVSQPEAPITDVSVAERVQNIETRLVPVLPGVSTERKRYVDEREDWIKNYMQYRSVGRTAATTAFRKYEKDKEKTVPEQIDINSPVGKGMAAVYKTDKSMVFNPMRHPRSNITMEELPEQFREQEVEDIGVGF